MAADASLLPRAAADDGLANEQHRIELRARCSLTQATASRFLWTVAIVTFAVASVFAAQGFWPILVFAALEIGLLAWALQVSMRSGQIRETITVDEQFIRIEHSGPNGSCSTVFLRYWSKVTLQSAHAASHPSVLWIESRGRVCEVGRFLTEDERRALARRLKQLVGNMNESPTLG